MLQITKIDKIFLSFCCAVAQKKGMCQAHKFLYLYPRKMLLLKKALVIIGKIVL